MALKNSSRKKSDQFSTDNETTPLIKVSASGNNATFHTNYPQKWYETLGIFYHDRVEQNNPFIISHWTDSRAKDDENKLLGTIIKYINKSNPEDVLTLTITLYHTSGTVLVQGAADCVKIWQLQHLPDLVTIFKNLDTTVLPNPAVATIATTAPRTSQQNNSSVVVVV